LVPQRGTGLDDALSFGFSRFDFVLQMLWMICLSYVKRPQSA
jgi:hypothetical protein